MTWDQFKAAVEAHGVQGNDEVGLLDADPTDRSSIVVEFFRIADHRGFNIVDAVEEDQVRGFGAAP